MKIPKDHSAALLGLDTARIWVDCNYNDRRIQKVQEFLDEVREGIKATMLSSEANPTNLRKPSAAPYAANWDPPNHADALLALNVKKTLSNCLKEFAKKTEVLFFITRAYIVLSVIAPKKNGRKRKKKRGNVQAKRTRTRTQLNELVAECNSKLVYDAWGEGKVIRLAKTFQINGRDKDYEGCIESVDVNEDDPRQLLFHIIYQDDDEEDLDAEELLVALRHPAISANRKQESEDVAKWIEEYVL